MQKRTLISTASLLFVAIFASVNLAQAAESHLSVKSTTASSITLTATYKNFKRKAINFKIRKKGGDDNYTKLLLHADGTNGSTVFHDECKSPVSGRTIAVPGITVSTAQYKFGTGSASFPGGASNYIALNDHDDWNWSGGLWTYDAWIRANDLTSERTIFSQRTDTDNYIKGAINTNGALIFVVRAGGTTTINLASSNSSIAANTWYHVAFVENNNDYALYINGTRVASSTTSSRLGDYTGYFVIGYKDIEDTNPFYGYMDEMRVTKGVARWTDSSFTLPTKAYGYTDSIVEFKKKKLNSSGKVNLEITDLLPNTEYTFSSRAKKSSLKKYSSYSREVTGSTSK